MATVLRFKKKSSGTVVEERPASARGKTGGGVPKDQRVRQQEILTALGLLALKGTPFPELLQHTARLTAEGLRAEFCKVLEFIPATNRLLVCAGVGWDPGVVGSATVGADLESPAGYALRTGAAVISNHLENEERFRTPELLVEYGILEVDSRSEGEFSEQDIVFLQGAANLLGMAIERQRIELDLRSALDRQKLLLAEVNHRVNNSLQIVGSMLHMQVRTTTSAEVREQLRDAASRISAIARAHQRLYRTDEFTSLDLGIYIQEVIADFCDATPGCVIQVDAPEHVVLSTDRAITVALLINELVTNVAKYAYPGGGACSAWVTLARRDREISIIVRDKGVGMPASFDQQRPSGLGMRLIGSFSKQLSGKFAIHHREPGTEFEFSFPL